MSTAKSYERLLSGWRVLDVNATPPEMIRMTRDVRNANRGSLIFTRFGDRAKSEADDDISKVVEKACRNGECTKSKN